MDIHFIEIDWDLNETMEQIRDCVYQKVHVAIKKVTITSTALVLGRKALWSKMLVL